MIECCKSEHKYNEELSSQKGEENNCNNNLFSANYFKEIGKISVRKCASKKGIQSVNCQFPKD